MAARTRTDARCRRGADCGAIGNSPEFAGLTGILGFFSFLRDRGSITRERSGSLSVSAKRPSCGRSNRPIQPLCPRRPQLIGSVYLRMRPRADSRSVSLSPLPRPRPSGSARGPLSLSVQPRGPVASAGFLSPSVTGCRRLPLLGGRPCAMAAVPATSDSAPPPAVTPPATEMRNDRRESKRRIMRPFETSKRAASPCEDDYRR